MRFQDFISRINVQIRAILIDFKLIRSIYSCSFQQERIVGCRETIFNFALESFVMFGQFLKKWAGFRNKKPVWNLQNFSLLPIRMNYPHLQTSHLLENLQPSMNSSQQYYQKDNLALHMTLHSILCRIHLYRAAQLSVHHQHDECMRTCCRQANRSHWLSLDLLEPYWRLLQHFIGLKNCGGEFFYRLL